jgi:transglutaminase-like putative cysteine protease
MTPYLDPTPSLDADHPDVIAYAKQNHGPSNDPVKIAISLYYAVRDDIRYDPYSIEMSVQALKASTTIRTRRAWCVPKAALLAACCRVFKIPARLGYADVRNHLSTKRMREVMKTDIFHWHGYTDIFLNDQWVKATPAFNIELCEKFSIKVLNFDGTRDSIYQPFDLKGNRHMEYLRYRGEFADIPIDRMRDYFIRKYRSDRFLKEGDFDKEVSEESGKN